MRPIHTILFLALTFSNPAFAADEDGAAPGGRWLQPPAAGVLSDGGGQPLDARGPGALFPSVEAAAVDALTYAYLQARKANDTARMRGGTIYSVGDSYSYGEIQLGNPRSPNRIRYRFGPHERARFHAYPVYREARTNRANERLSRADHRSVRFVDPLHRPLYVLHPSLAIRVYRGEGGRPAEVTDLRRQERAPRFAEN